MKKEFIIFFTAVSFYTRIPTPRSFQQYNQNYLNEAIKYFPLIGWVAGFVAGVILFACNIIFGLPIAIALSMISSVLLTGAFHEDGFADVCDGFGGGWTKEKILDIMTDSRLGTYGVTGLIAILSLKFLSIHQLLSLPENTSGFLLTLLIFITAHSVSRFVAATLIFSNSYVRVTESKAKPATQKSGKTNLSVAALFAFVPLVTLVILSGKLSLLFILVPLYVTKKYFSWYFTKWIGGYTGDCLGAVQQVSEVVIYLSLIILWKFT